MKPAPGEKRVLSNLRKVIEEAPPIEKATLRHLARLLSAEELRPLDETLGRLRPPEKGGNR